MRFLLILTLSLVSALFSGGPPLPSVEDLLADLPTVEAPLDLWREDVAAHPVRSARLPDPRRVDVRLASLEKASQRRERTGEQERGD